MTTVERAARAICVTFGYDPDKDDEVGLGEDGDVNWNMFEDHARAVLTAIREPSQGMVDAGAQVIAGIANLGDCDGPAPVSEFASDAIEAHRAMINAALEEG